jgi:hypothetical protein
MTPTGVSNAHRHAMNRFANPATSSGPRDPIGAIEALWFQALAGGFHGPFCNCFAGPLLTLDARTLEADVLDYLLPRYAVERLHPLVEALKRRQTEPVGRFVDWLQSVPSAEITGSLYARLIDDISGILSSIGSSKAGFSCT